MGHSGSHRNAKIRSHVYMYIKTKIRSHINIIRILRCNATCWSSPRLSNFHISNIWWLVETLIRRFIKLSSHISDIKISFNNQSYCATNDNMRAMQPTYYLYLCLFSTFLFHFSGWHNLFHKHKKLTQGITASTNE